MDKQYDAVIAKTHTAEYTMHKYWARKPHNVVSYFLSELVPEGGTVLDPFCGSGVVLHEARKLGLPAVGFDVNPAAKLITEVLIDPPAAKDFARELEKRLACLQQEVEPFYKAGDRPIKYAVHEIVVQCENCGRTVPFSQAEKSGRSKSCPACKQRLKYNLENLADTRIKRIYAEHQRTAIEDPVETEKQKRLSDTEVFDGGSQYDYGFAANRRILTFEGMTTRTLFTPRNYSIICHIADCFGDIRDEKIRKAAQLLLTASAAQCSRLIPNRNDLSTGGPAWSVPGFWVPAEHLETNPIIHIRARYKKFLKAIEAINAGDYPHTAAVYKKDAASGIREYRESGKRADMIFFDPPYGDSVPYLEFSALWNSFLCDQPDLEQDISVSDRKPKSIAREEYKNRLKDVLHEISLTLSERGKLLITFNNNDMKAWEALLNGLQSNHLVCEYVTYQVPAVISSKAQFSPEGSYLSDIYSVYVYRPDSEASSDLRAVSNALKKAAQARDGMIALNLANRVIMLEWLRNNIRVDLLDERDNIIRSLFDAKENKLYYKGEIPKAHFSLKQHSAEAAKKILANGPCDWSELYKTIAIQYAGYGFLDPDELRTYLDGHIVIENKRCLSYLD